MQWVDIVLASVLALSVIVGLVRGFVFEVLSLLGWFVAYFAAQWLTPDVAPHIPVGKPGSGINHAAA
ncbi:MAG TPA: CvpA family protein, partial [Rhizobacter sp.]|nr:CvpA family protein [Rhizobacter sp.]